MKVMTLGDLQVGQPVWVSYHEVRTDLRALVEWALADVPLEDALGVERDVKQIMIVVSVEYVLPRKFDWNLGRVPGSVLEGDHCLADVNPSWRAELAPPVDEEREPRFDQIGGKEVQFVELGRTLEINEQVPFGEGKFWVYDGTNLEPELETTDLPVMEL